MPQKQKTKLGWVFAAIIFAIAILILGRIASDQSTRTVIDNKVTGFPS